MSTVSLVTGAASGIGAATARMLDERGDSVVCADLDLERAESVASSLGDAVAVAADVASEEDCETMVRAAVERYGYLWGQYHTRLARTGDGWQFTELILKIAGMKEFHRAAMHPIGRRPADPDGATG